MKRFFTVMMIILLEITRMNFKNTPEFDKDFKKLSKKFKSLADDLIEFKKVLTKFPLGIGRHFNVLTKTENVCIIKARFFCKSLKKKDLRVIYAYIKDGQTIEMVGIEFIEIYFKGSKANEDRDRINEYINNFN